MRFEIRFKDATTFDIPIALLQKKETTMLAVHSKPVWAKDSPVVAITASEVAEECWSHDTAAAIVAWYELPSPNDPLALPGDVELRDFVSIADWLLLDLGDLKKITFAGDDDSSTFVRTLRAKVFLKGAESMRKAITHVKAKMIKNPSTSYTFAFLQDHDCQSYISRAMATQVDMVGSTNVLSFQVQYGRPNDHFEWVKDLRSRQECQRRLEALGFEVKFEEKRLEMDGPRGMEYPPLDMNTVYGRRWLLNITLPDLPPDLPAKRRRLNAE